MGRMDHVHNSVRRLPALVGPGCAALVLVASFVAGLTSGRAGAAGVAQRGPDAQGPQSLQVLQSPQGPSATVAPAPAPSAPPGDAGTAPSAATTTPTTPDPLPGEVGRGDPAVTNDGRTTQGTAGPDAKTAYADQVPFDESMRQPLDRVVVGAKRALDDAVVAERGATEVVAAARADLAAGEEKRDSLDARYRQALTDADNARTEFERRAVDAYIRGNDAPQMLLADAHNANEYASRSVLLSSVVDHDRQTTDDYIARRSALGDAQRELLDRLAGLQRGLGDAEQAMADATLARTKAEYDVKVAEAGSHVLIEGFQFPVVGDVEFIDSFGFARNTTTTYSHWHEGTDVMAERGTPVVAVVDGTIKTSNNFLGGNALRLFAADGYWYYFAHMDRIADGIGDGSVVTAGQVIGYVGNTGDASGGPTHLHFEIHTPAPDSVAVDPYAILRVSCDERKAAEAGGAGGPSGAGGGVAASAGGRG